MSQCNHRGDSSTTNYSMMQLREMKIINKETINNDLLEKDDGTKNCIYKDLWNGIQGLVRLSVHLRG